jgi:hypothetical protein
MKNYKVLPLLIIFFSILLCSSCKESKVNNNKDEPKYKITRRDDGTLSGICQVDSMNLYHGLSKAYYKDGKTLHSSLNFNHGVKQGLSTKYYKNGQVSLYTNYIEGRMHGQSRKYYKNGSIMSIAEYAMGNVEPGLKEFKEDGTLVTYPRIKFREIDHLESHGRIDLEISCTKKSDKVNYFILENDDDLSSRIFLISEKGTLTRKFYVRPGESIDTRVSFLVEIPTDFGNVMVQKVSYQLRATN